MLQALHRLRERRDFASVYAQGKSYHSTLLRVTVLTREQMTTRFGVVISNKTAKSAVLRNRKKRQVRAALAPLLPKVHGGFDVVIGLKTPSCTASFEAISSDIVLLLQKARVLWSALWLDVFACTSAHSLQIMAGFEPFLFSDAGIIQAVPYMGFKQLSAMESCAAASKPFFVSYAVTPFPKEA